MMELSLTGEVCNIELSVVFRATRSAYMGEPNIWRPCIAWSLRSASTMTTNNEMA